MMGRLKGMVFRLLSRGKSLWWRCRGVRVGRGCILTGRASLRLCSGSSLILHDEVVLHSHPRYNKLISRPMELATIKEGACIELHAHCGLSGSKIVCANRVSIGEYTIVGPDTLIYDGKEHEYSPEIGWLGRKEVLGSPITIGKRCYIGTRCIILKGVTIGDDCVVAAGSLINRDIPSGHLAMGNPAVVYPLPAHLGGPAVQQDKI